MNLSIPIYRLLMHAYPAQFRRRFGSSLELVFRDMLRDAARQRGYRGLLLLWLQVIPDFLFSFAELVTKTAGDFLKWRLRLQWVIACSLGFGLARCIALVIGRELYVELGTRGIAGVVLGNTLQATVLMSSIGVMQAWVLAGRCFRRKQWVLYSVVGLLLAIVLTAFFFQPLLSAAADQPGLLRWAEEVFRGPLQSLAVRLVTVAPLWLLVGGFTGLLQAAAIKSDAITRYQWMRACAIGYFLSAMAGGFVIPYPYESILNVILTSVVSGAVMGLATSGPLERVLFNVQADSK